MNADIRTFEFKALPIEIEVKDLRFAKELPKLLGKPHKVESPQHHQERFTIGY